jgi:hypothetical protein
MKSAKPKAKAKPKAPRPTPEQRAEIACAKEITRVLKKHGFLMQGKPQVTAGIELFRTQS